VCLIVQPTLWRSCSCGLSLRLSVHRLGPRVFAVNRPQKGRLAFVLTRRALVMPPEAVSHVIKNRLTADVSYALALLLRLPGEDVDAVLQGLYTLAP